MTHLAPDHKTSRQRRLAFERFLANLSARLMALPPGDVDEAIGDAQRRMARFLELDRCSVWVRRSDDDLELTHQWTRPGMLPAGRLFARTALPWTYNRLMAGHLMAYSRLQDLPPEASVDVDTYRRHNQRSCVGVPLVAGGRVVGAMGFGTIRRTRRWPPWLLRRLKLLAHIFAHALDRKNAHETLRATEEGERHAREELAHVTRVVMLSELASSLAHELNQPLTAILTNAEAARRFLSSAPGEVDETLVDIVADVNRASAVINQMRDMVRKRTPRSEPVDLAPLVRDALLLIRGTAHKRGATIEVRAEPVPEVTANRVQLQQVVLNLVVNALDALEAGALEERRIFVSIEALDRHVRVAVADSGPGLSQAALDHLFLPFHTTKNEGLGLGLSICRNIIRTHGGRMGAQNNADRGATVWFTLPLDPSNTQGETPR